MLPRRGRAASLRAPVRTEFFATTLGWMGAAKREGRLVRLTCGQPSRRAAIEALGVQTGQPDSTPSALAQRLQAFAAGARDDDDFLDVPLDWTPFTPFQQAVLRACRRIPYGRVLTYGRLAAKAGYPRAARAAGQVMAANPFPLIVPCHRVVGAGGSLGGYSAPPGLEMKRRLLEQEGSLQPPPSAHPKRPTLAGRAFP